ncbi:hypothetical protein ACRALDRAFT_2026335 [Sodiomyces alcalophilus JCM 7366]|uniref:uncharacterized protein n=1 Tax=Sodiomyces alcalophilus JCM 7366 TaxID=591952 RepID=UPI0039B42145
MSPAGEAGDGETSGGPRPQCPGIRSISESNRAADSQDEGPDESDSQSPLISETADAPDYESFPPFESHDDHSFIIGCGVCHAVRRQCSAHAASVLRKVLEKDSRKKDKKKNKQPADSIGSRQVRPREEEDEEGSGSQRKSIAETIGAWFS